MSRLTVAPLPADTWGFGIVWNGRVKDLHFYFFAFLITLDCYFERKKK